MEDDELEMIDDVGGIELLLEELEASKVDIVVLLGLLELDVDRELVNVDEGAPELLPNELEIELELEVINGVGELLADFEFLLDTEKAIISIPEVLTLTKRTRELEITENEAR